MEEDEEDEGTDRLVVFSAQTHLRATPMEFWPFVLLILWRFPLITWMV